MNLTIYKSLLYINVLLSGSLLVMPCHATPSEKFHEMPWYDKSKETYKRYRPDEIPVDKPPPKKRFQPKLPYIPTTPFQIALYIIMIIAIIVIVYFIYKNRNKIFKTIKFDKVDTKAVITEMPFIKNEYQALTIDEIKNLIEKSLAEEKNNEAAMFIFLYLIRFIELKNILHVKPYKTARQYAREASAVVDKELCISILSDFEASQYSGAGAIHPGENWKSLRIIL